MTGDALVERVLRVIQDSSFDEDEILEYINEGLGIVSTLVDLPDLVEVDTVTTSLTEDYVDLPAGYQRKVTRVESVTNGVNISEPGRTTEYLKFRRRHPEAEDGAWVTDIAVRSGQLFYFPTPEVAEVLQVTFMKDPTDITTSTAPDCIPAKLHAPLLVSYAAAQIFELIEDGIEGAQVNTTRQNNKFETALAVLAKHVGNPDSEPVFTADEDTN